MEAGQGKALEWERIRRHFHHAVELEPAEREIYLQSACGDDAALRAEVRALLAEHDRKSGLLATGPTGYPAQFMLSPGDCLAGRFEIIRSLGAGGMGEVYEAHDRELGARVALKTLRPELVYDPKNRERFKHEILNGRKVTHPNICRIYDLAPDTGNERACLAFTMELLEGETLAAHLRRQPNKRLSVEEALPLVQQMAAGLEALHDQGIVHRDFKPGNVILVRKGDTTQVRITDFGLARRTEVQGQSLSGSHDLIGTPTYMAPEQLTGDRAKISPATDVYALGLVLYEMATGTRAYPAETLADNILQKTQGPPKPPRNHVPDLDENWDMAIRHCLAKEPQERPGSPSKVLATLKGEAIPPIDLLHGKKAYADNQRGSRAWSDPRVRWGAVTAVVAIFLALAVFLLRMPLVEEDRQIHVAVLPFAAMGSDAELPAFADGLMATITRRLTQFEGVNEALVVMAPSTVLSRGVVDPAAALEKLGANYVVEGDVQAAGDRLVLTLTLVDSEKGLQLDTAIVTGSRDNALALQDGAVRRLANMLDLRLQPAHLDSPQGLSELALGAAQFYTAGVGYLQRSDMTSNIENAMTQFQRAIELDDEYPLAHAGLCESQWRLHERTNDPKPLADAEQSCRRALRLNDQLPEAHIALGHVQTGQGKYEEAIESFNAAMELDPKSADALIGIANAYGRTDRTQEALASFSRAIALKPADWQTYHQLARFYIQRGEFEAAIRPLERALDLTPRSPQALSNLGMALAETGQVEAAVAYFERSVEIEPRAVAIANLGKALFDSERYREAVAQYEQAVNMKPHDFSLKGNLAAAYERIADARATATYLEAAALAQEALEVNPMLGELHSEIAHYYAGAHDVPTAQIPLTKALTRYGIASEREFFVTALTLARLGRVEEALAWLRESIERGYSKQKLQHALDTNPWLQGLPNPEKLGALTEE